MSSSSYFTRYIENVLSFKVKHVFLKMFLFFSTVIEWSKIDKNIRKSENLKYLQKFPRSPQNSVYNCHNPKEIKFLTRLTVDLSHLYQQKCKRNFHTLNPICHCGEDIETLSHYIRHGPYYL